ncbi:hypothetical protein NVP1084O_200 [Vibrio phage 1.084.O._10N.261.49.F5]|nr:hypothetical protein NVP1084O_200 [Vibrio phage 1.084.O._10N.261.49.F5]
MKPLTFSDKYNIEKYVNLDEGFEEIRPDLCKMNIDNICVAFHIKQLKHHREELLKWLGDNVEYEEG